MPKNIALMAGGDSSEWQISLLSAALIESKLDHSKYNTFKITVRDGRWYHTTADGREWNVDRNDFSLTIDNTKTRLEYALILIHGTPGEDGRLQGYLDMMRIPYSSSGFVSSVLTFDKSACKRALWGSEINLAKEILLSRHDQIDTTAIIDKLGLPLFAKPNASGSSFGVTKVKSAEQLTAAIEAAFAEGNQVLLEEYIAGREVSCGVMIAGGEAYIFPITELICETEFFDYAAKYQGRSKEVTPADVDGALLQRINAMTLAAYKTLNCRGVARVDFILKGDQPYFIEINTIPGMSEQSIIPQQAAAIGMSIGQLYDIIIEETCRV